MIRLRLTSDDCLVIIHPYNLQGWLTHIKEFKEVNYVINKYIIGYYTTNFPEFVIYPYGLNARVKVMR